MSEEDLTLDQLEEGRLVSVWGLAPALAKAVSDPFDYACGLRDGTVVHFHYASYSEGSRWIILHPHPYGSPHPIPKTYISVGFERGLNVLLTEIAWVADAPFGS